MFRVSLNLSFTITDGSSEQPTYVIHGMKRGKKKEKKWSEGRGGEETETEG